ncbi:hypothetical protein GALMADRAFT_78581 [Galerina marginata CBS 339.88]|uniref:FAD/NAD(P)-binding domain-containing protein n=1 Tax=Galerina marginata (strain CBS 339.88) TaxID=685588 RepID=A0A067SEP8_GALM3|nr:hypothetical protein GALMADRAFT_78581 [Galerina marginata CBS 339.88]
MADIKKKKIVVVGGGGAGASIVRGLSKVLDPSKHELMLITARPQFAYLPASLRVLVSPDAPINMVFMPYDTVFAQFPGELKIGTVSSIEENKDGPGGRVILRGGEEVAYDVLAVATGSAWEGLVSFPDEENLYKEHIALWRNKFETAQDIIIVGGGAVGIEAAGEIKDVYPDKNVTIVQGGKYLLTDIYPRKFRVDLERRLRLRGVKIVFEDHIDGHPEVGSDTPLKTRKGTPLKCDLLLSARGAGPNTSLLKFLQPASLTDRGLVQVLPSLQVRNHPTIFAAGDITDLQEAKQFQKTAGHAAVIVENIMSYLQGQQLKAECKPGKEIIIISNGRHGGAAYIGVLWGFRFGDIFTRLAKSRDLLVWVVRRNLGFLRAVNLPTSVVV